VVERGRALVGAARSFDSRANVRGLWKVPGAVPRDPVDWERRGDEPVSVLVVDDQESFLTALREVVAATEGFELVGEATSGERALAAADELSPQFVIMDKRMPGLGGVEATRLITSHHPNIVVLIVSVEDPHAHVLRSSGAAGFIRKQDLSPRVLLDLWREHGQ
jgi:two-component system, NarL family, invasion response regulator UvrY